MGHLGTNKTDVFRELAERLNKNPIGAPFNETLMRILHIMYTEQEAVIGGKFPPGFVTLDKLSTLTGLPPEELTAHLANMAAKGLVRDIPRKNRVLYSLSPLVVGFFEYTFMRATSTLPLKDLADLFEQYHHEHGVAEEFFGAQTKMFQTWAYESAMPAAITTEVLDYEKASAMIRDSGKGALTMCYCRHQALHRGTVCDAPIEDVCTSLGVAAEWLISKGFARPASTDELLRVLERTEKLGLVHLADNVRNNPAFICHCCGCCCGVLRTVNEHGIQAVQPSNFIAKVDTEKCSGCGSCTERCHIGSLTLNKTDAKATVASERCLGCAVCVRSCPQDAIELVRRSSIYIPPKDKTEQMINIAREHGKL